MMITRAVMAEPASLVWKPGKSTADVTLILPILQKIGNRKGGVAITIFSDPLPWNPVHGHFLELIDGDWFDLSGFDAVPGDIEGRRQKWSRE